MNSSKFEYLLDKLPVHVDLPSDKAEQFKLSIVFDHLLTLIPENDIKDHFVSLSNSRKDVSLDDLINDLILRKLDVLKNPDIFKEKFVFEEDLYSFHQIDEYSEFSDLGVKFNNCLFGYQRFVQYAFSKHLIKVLKDGKLYGLLHVEETGPAECTVSKMLGNKNKVLSDSETVSQILAKKLKTAGYRVLKNNDDRVFANRNNRIGRLQVMPEENDDI